MQKRINKKFINKFLLFSLTILALLASLQCKNLKDHSSLDSLKTESQKNMDTIIQKINKKIVVNSFADSIANSDSTITGLQKLDSLILLFPNNGHLYLYRGIWYANHKKYQDAISEFSMSERVNGVIYPNLADQKAKAFLAIGQFKDALEYYRIAATYSDEYNLRISKIFEESGNLD
ncbi:MAG: hypothetical protein J7497_04170, partial [Chitinophagaceae bacterium]|nr:hypothetical protein [Chitinophagaceae bacterium]